jgi:beta-glucuronidase
VQQVMSLEAIDEGTAKRRVRQNDDARTEYGRKLYGVDPADLDLYHLVIDSTSLDIATCDLLRPKDNGDPRTKVAHRAVAIRRGCRGRWAGRGLVAAPLSGAREIPVPASYNDIFPDRTVHDHVGDMWYQTAVRVPARWEWERIVPRCDAATHRAVVRVGETQVAEHEGVYTPFEADITDVVELGVDNRITVVVSNILNWQSIPPGRVEQTPDGPRQRYFHDFFNYAGLHRPVWLTTRPAAYISDITVVTYLDGETGTVYYAIETAGAEAIGRTRRAEGR